MAARWHCRLCKAWGLGGPDGWRKHADMHKDGNRYSASMSFGFTPNYSTVRPVAPTRYGTMIPTRLEESL